MPDSAERPDTPTGTRLGHHCAAHKERIHLTVTEASDPMACRQLFVELSGGAIGCPVHGIRESLEAAYDRRKRAEQDAAARKLLSDIDRLEPPRPPTTEDGIYMVDGDVIKVQLAVHGSGRPYAKKLDKQTGKWEYVPGLVYKLKPEQKLTQEQAKEFGLLYGRCAICGRTLTKEESISRAMGPVCASRMGWL